MNPHTQTRFALILLLTSLAHAISPSPSEMSEAHRWTAAKFNNLQISPSQEPGLVVLENHGPVQANGRGPEPLRIGAKTYEHGLYCHANSRVLVRLPSPGKTFQADIGVDTRAGGGSIIFSVRIADREAFRSEVMRIDHPATPVKTDLAGATEFTLNINDAGDNITSDQGNWADAKVQLNDGSDLLLGDLPIQGGQRAAYTLDPPFSFTYAGQPSSELLTAWKTERSSTAKDPSRKEHTVTYTDPATGLAVRCVATEWLDSPAVEWTLYLKNTGHTDTPLIENIQALDTLFPAPTQADPTLRYNTGDLCTPDSYAPHDEPIPAGSRKRIANTGGRPTQSAFPYFNMATPGEGVIMALGWPGQWASEFTRESAAAPPHRRKYHWCSRQRECRRCPHRRSASPASPRRPGAHPLQTPPRRSGPHAARRPALLPRRLAPRPEPLAPLDGRPQPAPPRRPARPAYGLALHGQFLCRPHEQRI